MFKLLTPESRARVASEYLLRRTVLMAEALILVLLVAMAGLFPSYILSKAKQEDVLADNGSAVGVSVEGGAELEAWLNQLNAKLQALSPEKDAAQVSKAVEEVIAERGIGISLTEFNWSESEGVMELSVSGLSKDRQALLAFQSSLNASGHFSEATLPVSNLAKEKDISFQIKLVPKKTP